MNWGIFIPLAVVTIGPIAWVVTTWIRASHGYPIREGKDLLHPASHASERQIELLSNENEHLKGQVVRLEERISVLERIATDEPARLGREIESLALDKGGNA